MAKNIRDIIKQLPKKDQQAIKERAGKLIEEELTLQQLRKAGLKLAHADIKDCNPKDEATGCLPELVELGYPCKSRKMCQNYLFVR